MRPTPGADPLDPREPVLAGPVRVDNALVFRVEPHAAAAAAESLSEGKSRSSGGYGDVLRYAREYQDAGASLTALFPEQARSWKDVGGEGGIETAATRRAARGGTRHLRVAHHDHLRLLKAKLQADPAVHGIYRPVVQYALARPTPASDSNAALEDALDEVLPWGVERCRFSEVWDDLDRGPTPGPIAVIDDGIDYRHPEVRDRVGTPQLRSRPRVPSRSIHASAVAGVITASRKDGSGVSGCCSARVDLYNVWSKTRFESAAFYEALRMVARSRARVLNLCIGSTTPDPAARALVAECIAKGMIVVAAMGNEFRDGNPPVYPAAYPGVIGVGAMTRAEGRAEWSTTGENLLFSAPGVDVLTLQGDDDVYSREGTSFAAPMVAAAAWLILRARPCWTARQVRDLLEDTAVRIPEIPSSEVGHGRVDMVNIRDELRKRPCPHPQHRGP
jgi:hypothetical protein